LEKTKFSKAHALSLEAFLIFSLAALLSISAMYVGSVGSLSLSHNIASPQQLYSLESVKGKVTT
jgi:hypothetical protein